MESIHKKPIKTYVNMRKLAPKTLLKPQTPASDILNPIRKPLTTKKAVELLLKGTLRSEVCRYCLHISQPISELDQYMHIAGRGAEYTVTIRDMVASVHPFKVTDDPNFPNKICNKCLNQAMRSYLFAQQCERAERALRNCFDDMSEKLGKLDPLERVNKRGRQKLNPNHNILYTEHRSVIDYAEPMRNLINAGSFSFTKEPMMSELECKKCWQVLPDLETLVYHEKLHPKSMWYNCRICGKSFAKLLQMKRHMRLHDQSKQITLREKTSFECRECPFISENYLSHLQHIEKHKFQNVLEHLVQGKMDKLCSVCFEKGKLEGLDKVICLHGGYPELTGDRSICNILGSTTPEMNILNNYTGTKICEKCLNNAITSYVFINRTHYMRNRLETCVTSMLDNLNTFGEPENTLFIEIAQNSIVPMVDQDEIDDYLLEENEVDETKLKVEVLEDEFRLKSENEDSDNDDSVSKDTVNTVEVKVDRTKLRNGYQYSASVDDVCSEFLTFRKKIKTKRKVYKCKFTCPLCNKHFISDYFLKVHVQKHVNRKVECKICRNEFKSKFYLHEHIKMAHLLKLDVCISCKICGRLFVDEKRFILHQNTHKRKQCQLCLKVFATQKCYESHMQRHAFKLTTLKQNEVQTCSFCEQECPNDNQLSIHVNKTHLQIKPYYCDMCDRQFYTEKNLLNHKKVHNMFSKEKCEFCNKTFRCRKNLVIHIRKHIGIKPYRCFICPQSFYSEFQMNIHTKKWHGGSFCCKLCKKVFVNRNGLKNHVNRSHSVF